ncbi:glycosyltransferase family 4 protein [Demequina sp. EGI L300058]|uniref:D-inositol 3-phosphate glycosyltransferase n=1 Tax=Demequina muriae TaxID=3051664 RepID=A0ABT8GJZ3_9MICO|nr:glycosyltransferase family 4 protein [Demequina sp. EGI L300058]
MTHTAELGGAELALLRLVAALEPGEFDVHVVTWSHGDLVDRLETDGIPVTVIAGRGIQKVTRTDAGRVSATRSLPATVGVARQLRRVLRSLDPDLVVANSLKAAVVVGLVAGMARQPWVWHLHDRLAPDYLPAPVARAMGMLAARGPRGIVANSEATAATLPLRAQERTVVAYPGLAPALAQRERVLPAAPVVGLVGRISPTKGQLEFIQAAHQVRRRHPDARFVIVGTAMFADAPYEQEVRQAAGDTVEMVGWTDDPAGTIAGLSVLVHASPTPEPFGQVVAEAVALGVAVVGTEAGGVPEIMVPQRDDRDRSHSSRGPHGVLVAPGDVSALAGAVSALLDDPRRLIIDPDARAEAADRLSIARTAGVVAQAWRRHST